VRSVPPPELLTILPDPRQSRADGRASEFLPRIVAELRHKSTAIPCRTSCYRASAEIEKILGTPLGVLKVTMIRQADCAALQLFDKELVPPEYLKRLPERTTSSTQSKPTLAGIAASNDRFA